MVCSTRARKLAKSERAELRGKGLIRFGVKRLLFKGYSLGFRAWGCMQGSEVWGLIVEFLEKVYGI